jgi:hypothetical protein
MLSPLPSWSHATSLPSPLRVLSPLPLPLLPLLTCDPVAITITSVTNCHLIAVSKRWAMGTAAAMAALRATALGDCGGGSSDDDGYRYSGGEDNNNGGKGIGDDCPCCPLHCPLCHPPHCCQRYCPCCCHCHCICQHATKRAMVRAARAMAMATTRAMKMAMKKRARARVVRGMETTV